MLHDPLFILAVGVATIVGLIVVFRVNAFLSLLAAAFLVSFLAPVPRPPEDWGTFLLGFLETPVPPSGIWGRKVMRVCEAFGVMAGKVGILIAMGSIVGKCMMDSGSAARIILSLRKFFGERLIPASLLSGGFILSIPVFYEATFYLMVPIARSVYRATKKNYILYLMAIGLGATISHTLIPPTPGPVAAALTLNVPIGTMMLVGVMVGALTAPFALGIAALMNYTLPHPELTLHDEEEKPAEDVAMPSLWESLLPIIVPVILIAALTVFQMFEAEHLLVWTNGQPAWRNVLDVLGNPQIAMIFSALVSMFVLAKTRKLSFHTLEHRTEAALIGAGLIILIVSAGGAFGEMLRAANVGERIEMLFRGDKTVGLTGSMLLCVAFGVAALIKTAQGSSTTAMITTAAVFNGVVLAEGAAVLPYNIAYLAVAIGLGSCVTGWMNDGGFWLFCRMGGVKETDALRTWTVGLVLLGLSGLGVVLVLSRILPLL